MTRNEMIEKVARDLAALNDGTEETWESFHADAQKACSTIFAALQEPTPKALDSAVAFALNVQISSEYKWTAYMTDVWGKMLNASQLGEQSE